MSKTAQLKKKAAEFEQKRQYDRAIAAYIQALEAITGVPEEPDIAVYNRVGDLYCRSGAVAKALDFYERAVDLYVEAGFFSNATAICKKALRHAPSHSSIYYKLGIISARTGFASDARKNFLEYAEHMRRTGNEEEAFRALKELADLCPGQDDVRLMLAEQLARAGRPAEALDQLHIVYDAMVAEDRTKEAAATLTRMRALDPSVQPRSPETPREAKREGLVFLDVHDDTPSVITPVEGLELTSLVPEDHRSYTDSDVESSLDIGLDPDAGSTIGSSVGSTADNVAERSGDSADIYGDSFRDEPGDLAEQPYPAEQAYAAEQPYVAEPPHGGPSLELSDVAPPIVEWDVEPSGSDDLGFEPQGGNVELEYPADPPSVIEAAAHVAPEPPPVAPAPAPARTPAPDPAPSPAPDQAPRGDDSFVDLADWLREDQPEKNTRMVADEDVPPEGTAQIDFTEMLETFKRGVDANVEDGDSDSHYDLGVAFREMGLVDEAITQFQKALRDSNNRIRAYEALGQCFIDRGQFDVARTLLSRAIRTPNMDDEPLVGVLYLLGYASEVLNRWPDAATFYQRVFAVDINFRDISERLERATAKERAS